MSYRNTVTGSFAASGTTETTNYIRAYCRHQVPVIAGFQLTGTFVGTVLLEATMDGTTWVSVAFVASTAPGTLVTSATAVGMFATDSNYMLPLAYRVRCSAYTSGAIVATLTLLPIS